MARRKYARVSWMVEDLADLAKEHDVELTDDDARQLLQSKEKRLEESMIAAGWTVLDLALSDLRRSREVPDQP